MDKKELQKKANEKNKEIQDHHRAESTFSKEDFIKIKDKLDDELRLINNQLKQEVQTSFIKKTKTIQTSLQNLDIIKKEICGDKTAGRKVDNNSYLSTIFNLLCSGNYKNVNEVCKELKKIDPSREEVKNIEQVKRTIYRTKRQESERYKQYKWIEDKFLMVKK